MKKLATYYLFSLSLLMLSCSSSDDFESSGVLSDSSGTSDPNGNGQSNQTGLITAAEWNDLDNWQFWKDIIAQKEYTDILDNWSFYNNNRVSILLTYNNQPVIDADLELSKDGEIIWESKSDNQGKSEMWIGLFERKEFIDISEYSLLINGIPVDIELRLYTDGINKIELNTAQELKKKVEVCFIVDATSSMSDELEFLKDDLTDVIEKVKSENSSLQIYTSSVFYRDEKEDYVVKKSEFSDNINTTIDFIKDQNAAGGGDFPEAVHSALISGIEELQWSNDAKARLAFLLLDAPPHHDSKVIEDLQQSIRIAAKKGIKIIPITASGIDKPTEFLMRFFSISTNSSYVFITNDSGIGNDHLEPTVGEYEVEYLNELMVRLINKYSE